MAFECKILCDSINESGDRLTTFQITFPRIVLAELNTHRMFSRNSSSSRAIPIKKTIEKIQKDPFIPLYWGINQPGMQSYSYYGLKESSIAKKIWLEQRDIAIEAVKKLSFEKYKVNKNGKHQYFDFQNKFDLLIHKQTSNRLLEPWMWSTVIVSATDYHNFFDLRCAEDAEPHIQKIAKMMEIEYYSTEPFLLKEGQWHLPLIFPEDESFSIEDKIKLSVARCARTSYLTHDGKREPIKDFDLYEKLVSSKHLSPLEHVATPVKRKSYIGNFKGWKQWRKIEENKYHDK